MLCMLIVHHAIIYIYDKSLLYILYTHSSVDDWADHQKNYFLQPCVNELGSCGAVNIVRNTVRKATLRGFGMS